ILDWCRRPASSLSRLPRLPAKAACRRRAPAANGPSTSTSSTPSAASMVTVARRRPAWAFQHGRCAIACGRCASKACPWISEPLGKTRPMNSITQLQQEMLSRMQQLTALAEGRPAQAMVKAQEERLSQSFAAVLRAIDDQQHKADAAMAAVSKGESDDLVGAMVTSMRASISFSALVQVRNKL